MPTIFKPFSKDRCARCSDFPIYNDKENYPGYYESSREYRINGYCSNYCEDMAEVEDREIDLESKLLNEALKRESVLKELEKLITNMFVYANEQYKKEAFIDADKGYHGTQNKAYWQGRKDGLRAIRAEIKGRNFEALDQAETYTSLEEQEDAG